MGEGHDQRDSRSWVVIELTRAGEGKVEDGTIAPFIREALKVDASYPVFVPSISYESGGRRTTIHLMEGYVFVLSGLPEVAYFGLEGRNLYVRKVLTTKSPSGLRVLSVIPDESVQEMRKQLSQQVSTDLVDGMRVVVTDGVYTNLDGEILGFHGSDAHVRFVLRSLDLIAQVPKVFLIPVKEDSG
jgi:hypothetical protein